MDTVPQSFSWGGKSTQQFLSFPPSSTHHVLTWMTWKEKSKATDKCTREITTGVMHHVTCQTCNPAAMCGSKTYTRGVSTARTPTSYVIETLSGSPQTNIFHLTPTPAAAPTDKPVTPEWCDSSPQQAPVCERRYPARVRIDAVHLKYVRLWTLTLSECQVTIIPWLSGRAWALKLNVLFFLKLCSDSYIKVIWFGSTWIYTWSTQQFIVTATEKNSCVYSIVPT